jgi:uncharacterized protein (UPF0335 family)
MLEEMPEKIEDAVEQRLSEHVEDIERLNSGDPSALADLLEACTGAKVQSVDVKTLV